jgi:hypothetical protein
LFLQAIVNREIDLVVSQFEGYFSPFSSFIDSWYIQTYSLSVRSFFRERGEVANKAGGAIEEPPPDQQSLPGFDPPTTR